MPLYIFIVNLSYLTNSKIIFYAFDLPLTTCKLILDFYMHSLFLKFVLFLAERKHLKNKLYAWVLILFSLSLAHILTVAIMFEFYVFGIEQSLELTNFFNIIH